MDRRRGVMVCCALSVLLALAASHRADAAESPWLFVPRATNPALTPRVFGAAAGQNGGAQVVTYGGQRADGSAPLAETWVHDASGSWVPRCGTTVTGATGACGPGPRVGLGMGTGPAGAVLFGGFPDGLGAGPPQGDTWAWDGGAWQQICTEATCGPGGRGLSAMAGNGTQVVLFGGITASGLVDDTWVFDGSTWSQTCGGSLPLACGPAPLAAAAMAWDGEQFVLFGGTDPDGGGTVDDTWTFDGASWARVCGTATGTPCGPPARGLSAFAFASSPQPQLQGAVLAEGGDLFGPGTQTLYRDAWFWHAGTWSELAAPWSGDPVTFVGEPPPGAHPLLGVLAARPSSCDVLFLATGLTATGPPPDFDAYSFTGGRDLAGTGQPAGCAAPVSLPAPTTTPTTSVPVRAVSTATSGPAAETIADTGPSLLEWQLASAIALILLGASLVGLARGSGATEYRDAERGGRKHP